MTIETKYNIGDKVWFMHDNSVHCETIIKIDVVIEKGMYSTDMYKNILYYLYDYVGPYIESKISHSKEELLKSL